jgi:hypothetical protein
MYLPFISRIALAQSMGSKNETNPYPRALFSCFARTTYIIHERSETNKEQMRGKEEKLVLQVEVYK